MCEVLQKGVKEDQYMNRFPFSNAGKFHSFLKIQRSIANLRLMIKDNQTFRDKNWYAHTLTSTHAEIFVISAEFGLNTVFLQLIC